MKRFWLYTCWPTAVLAVSALVAGCAHRVPKGEDWASELAVRPGSSLPREGDSQIQTITLASVSQQRPVGRQFFIAGVGVVAFNGGGTSLAGYNRKLDPFVELTIADRNDRALASCRSLLAPESLNTQSLRIAGPGHFAALPGVFGRQLAVVRVEKVSRCELVPKL